MTICVIISGICLISFVVFEVLYIATPAGFRSQSSAGDGFYIFTLWMMFLSYGIASLCQILMFTPPRGPAISTTTEP
jgi:hypothetical protein